MSGHIVSITTGLAIAIREKLFTLIGYQKVQPPEEVDVHHTVRLVEELQKAIDREVLK